MGAALVTVTLGLSLGGFLRAGGGGGGGGGLGAAARTNFTSTTGSDLTAARIRSPATIRKATKRTWATVEPARNALRRATRLPPSVLVTSSNTPGPLLT